MAKKIEGKQIFSQKKWYGGLSNFLKEEIPNTFYFAQSIDFRTDPQALTLLPASVKKSGSVVTDLLKWADTTPQSLDVYSYGNTGNIYKRTTAGSWSNLHTVPSSHGNGLQYFYGDDYLYYANDNALGRYGPVSASSPQFTDDFLKSQGGVPTNTASLVLVSASSQYATAVSSASLQITGDITLETEFKATTLPAVGSSMTLLGKWDESGATRSYKMDLFGVSGYFGNGQDGALTIAVNTTEAPIDSACTGTAGSTALSATNVSFAVGQVILVLQTRGTNAGQYERNTIQGYTAGTITLQTPLMGSYGAGAQVRVMKQYTNVTINSGITYTAKPWNGTTGGILAFLANGTVTVAATGKISADGCGFRGGTGVQQDATTPNHSGYYGESINQAYNTGYYSGTPGSSSAVSIASPVYAGGGANSVLNGNGGGGGAGFGTIGQTTFGNGLGGTTYGTTDATQLHLGSGGGGGGDLGSGSVGGNGGNGGGLLFFVITTLANSGTISSNGQAGTNGNANGATVAGGSGTGGQIAIKAQTVTLGTMTASGATGTFTTGGQGGDGRIHADYLTSVTGGATPTITTNQDNTLVTTTTYQARLGISNDGTASEYLTQNLATLTVGTWNRLSISWAHSSATAKFYLNGNLVGTSVGTKTAISSNAGALSVGANKVASYQNFFNGELNDMRIWSNVQTPTQIYNNNEVQIPINSAGLAAYYTFNSVYTDGTTNANALTAINSPVFTTSDVPWPGYTTRLDIDQQYTTTGQTYTLKTAISEAVSDVLTFTPQLDPQKSVDFNISAKGTGNWTVTVHDSLNNTVATQTISNAQLPSSGYYEFVFGTPWRIVINKTYHFHLTSTVADGVVVCSAAANFATADFHTYYQFLVSDSAFHPIARMLNKIVIGNERYLATWDGAFYNANLIAFPQGTHVRCFGFWRDYLAIGVWQENSSGTGNIYDWSTGRIYFWDGIALTFNFWIDVAEGQINALYGVDTNLYIMAGYSGQMLLYQGGYIYASGNSISSKVRKMPYLGATDSVEVYPQAITQWHSLLHIGMGANSTSSTLYRGVYSFGSLTPPYPEALSFDYPISTGNTGSTVNVGLVYPAGQTLLVGWQDGISYGVDEIGPSNPPASFGTLQTLIQDDEAVYHKKSPMKVRADHLALKTGEGVTAKYKIDRESSWESLYSVTDNATKRFTTNQIADGFGYEYQLAVDLTQTGGTSPTLLGVSALVDGLDTEEQL